MEAFISFVWVPLLAPILVGITIASFQPWISKDKK